MKYPNLYNMNKEMSPLLPQASIAETIRATKDGHLSCLVARTAERVITRLMDVVAGRLRRVWRVRGRLRRARGSTRERYLPPLPANYKRFAASYQASTCARIPSLVHQV